MVRQRMAASIKEDIASLASCLVLLPLSLAFTLLGLIMAGGLDEEAIGQAGIILLGDDLAENLYARTVALPILIFATTIALGHIMVRSIVRRRIARRTFTQKIISVLVHTAFFIVGVISTALLSIHAGLLFAFVLATVLILDDITALSEAYLIHARGILPFREVVNAENVIDYTLSNTAIILISVLPCLAVYFVNSLIGLVAFFTILPLSLSVADVNAERRVKALKKGRGTAD